MVYNFLKKAETNQNIKKISNDIKMKSRSVFKILSHISQKIQQFINLIQNEYHFDEILKHINKLQNQNTLIMSSFPFNKM